MSTSDWMTATTHERNVPSLPIIPVTRGHGATQPLPHFRTSGKTSNSGKWKSLVEGESGLKYQVQESGWKEQLR